jgi:hypothetical protein
MSIRRMIANVDRSFQGGEDVLASRVRRFFAPLGRSTAAVGDSGAPTTTVPTGRLPEREAPAPQPDILIVTVVWGAWHLRAFLDVNLPTLLAPGNFPALFAKYRGVYRIYTRLDDIEQIKGAPTFQRLSELVPVALEIIEDERRLQRPIETHVEIWRDAVAEAARIRSLALLMPPDVLWSNGSFAHVADLLGHGKRQIYSAFFRVVSNSFLPAFRRRFGEHPDQVAVSGDDLVGLCLEHVHPIMAAHARDSRYFPYHPEMAVWPVPNQGLAVRVFARELMLYDPRRVRLGSSQLIVGEVPWDELHMVSDSDHLFGVSLAPFGKDASWHRTPWLASTREVARWWLEYDSPANDYVAGVQVRWHFRPIDERHWQPCKIGADLFTRRAALEREVLRVVGYLVDDVEARALQVGRLLALLVVAGRAARALRNAPRLQKQPIFVFVPEDDALDAGWFADCLAAIDRHDGRLERMLRNQVALAPAMLDLERLGDTDAVALDFLGGAHRALKRRGRGWTIGDVAVTTMHRLSAMLTVCHARGLLDEVPATRTADAADGSPQAASPRAALSTAGAADRPEKGERWI